MSNYSIVPDAALTATANAIRTKSGSQSPIEFDHNTGFKSAVDAIPSGGGPDLSSDTVTAGTLLEGVTAHDASGDAITGTMTGEDLIAGKLTITYNLAASITVQCGKLSWDVTTKKLKFVTQIKTAGNTEETYLIPTGACLWGFTYSSTNPIEITNPSSGVTLWNNGQPVISTGTSTVLLVRVLGSASRDLSFTVSSVAQEQEG